MVSTKTKVSPKIAMGVLLVVIGVAFGAVGFNALVPTVMTPRADTSVIAQTTGSTWIYVYGPGKSSSRDYTALQRAITNGANVKIQLVNNSSNQVCTSVQQIPSQGNIFCYTNILRDALLGEKYYEESRRIQIVPPVAGGLDKGQATIMATIVEYSQSGTDRISSNEMIVPVKWYIQK